MPLGTPRSSVASRPGWRPALPGKRLGGHDLRQILRTLARAAQMPGPLMILAYTTKGWGLPIAGHLENHAALLPVSWLDGSVLWRACSRLPGCAPAAR